MTRPQHNIQMFSSSWSSVFVTVVTLSLFISWSVAVAQDTNSTSNGIKPLVITDDDTSNTKSTVNYNEEGLNDNGESTEMHRHESNKSHNEHGDGHRSGALRVASWQYHEIRDPLIFTVVLVLAGVCKIGYHHSGFLSSKIPESCILIVLGVVFGTLIHYTGAEDTLPTFFNPHEFFIYLLPPIILEAAFSLHDRTFIENFGSILLFAVVGTIFACAFVGLSLFGLSRAGAMGPINDIGFVELMVFSSLIVAVDPVAVLAVFNEIGVNQVLYFLVFGESLLNDGVTVVLYKVFQSYNVMDEITGVHILLGFVKFFVVCLGGWVLGVLAGILSALLTKCATHVKVAQPLIIYTMAYLGFLCAELFEFSGIICLVGCGITQKHYAFNNISDKSRTTITYFTKVISTACETIIFMFLGLSIITDNHEWHTGFTLWTIVLCNLYRFMITFGLSFLINKLDFSRVRKISLDEQFMIAYGGLRGAVCFSLVVLLHPEEFPDKNMYVTTTIAVILFTVFIQGITIKPLITFLQVRLAPQESKSMYKELHEHVTDHLMAGIEDIIGDHGKNHLREKMQYLDVQYIQPFLLVSPDPCDVQLKEFYQHLVMKEHYNHMKASNVKQMEQIPEFRQFLDKDGPHITTELFLKGLLSPPNLESSGMGEGTAPMATLDESQSNSTAEDDVVLRNRRSKSPRGSKSPKGSSRSSRSSRSPSHEKSPSRASTARSNSALSTPDVSNAKALRSLLKQNTISRAAFYDRNLTVQQDFQSEFKRKSDQNRRMRRFSTPDGLNHRFVVQQSWCEADCDMTQKRRDMTGAGRYPDARTRRDTIDPIYDPSHVMPTSQQLSQLTSVHEENEETDKSGGLTSDDNVEDSNDENEPMIPGEEGEEERIRRIKKKGRRSTKHRLERQGGLDTQISDSGDGRGGHPRVQSDVPLENMDGGGGRGDCNVTVQIDNSDGTSSVVNGETTSSL